MKISSFTKYLFTVMVMLFAVFLLPKTPTYAMTEDQAADIENEYIEKHNTQWGKTNPGKENPYLTKTSYGAVWDKEKGKLIVMGADAYAVDASVIDNIVSDKYTTGKYGTALKDIISYLSTGKCRGTKSCAARCSQSVRDKGCKDQCSVSSTNMENACKGHGWTLSEIKKVKEVSNNCDRGVSYVFVQVQCTTSEHPCGANVWLCLFSPFESDHDIHVRDLNDKVHEYYCINCDYSRTEAHSYGTWEYPSKNTKVHYCKVCDHAESEAVAEVAAGLVNYNANYPKGTEHGASRITDTYTFHPNTEYTYYEYPEVTANKSGYYTVYNPDNGKSSSQYVKKDEKYNTRETKTETIDNSAKNVYKVKDKTAQSEQSDKFWARYVFDYSSNDATGSTRAHNVPTSVVTRVYLRVERTSPSVGSKLTYKTAKDQLDIEVTFDQQTPVTVEGKNGIWREGYIPLGWTASGWNGAVWHFGETRSGTLPSGTAMKSKSLKVKWQKENYKLVYNVNTPSSATSTPYLSEATGSATFDEPQSHLASASLTGWIFEGWYTASGLRIDEGTIWTYDPNPTAGQNETIQLYAHWTPITYDVILMANKPSVSISDMQLIYNGTAWTWSSLYGGYVATFTYDSAANIPTPGIMYAMLGWDIGSYWSRTTNESEPYVGGPISNFGQYGNGTTKWNLSAYNGDTIYLYSGWNDKDPSTTENEAELYLNVTGAKSNTRYAHATKTALQEPSPYYMRTITGANGYTRTWESRWLDERVWVYTQASDFGSGLSDLKLIPTRVPSQEAKDEIDTWTVASNVPSSESLSMNKYYIYEGTTTLHSWAQDFSNKYGVSDGSENRTVDVTVKIDQLAPRGYTYRTTGTFDAPLSGDGNPYVGNPAYDDYKYTGAVVEDSEMETLFAAVIDDRNSRLLDVNDVAGIASVWVEVWNSENENEIKSFEMSLDSTKTMIRNADDTAWAYGNYKVRVNLYQEFPDAANIRYKVIASDVAGNRALIYDSATASEPDHKVNESGSSYTGGESNDDTPEGTTGVAIRNISIRTWITRDDTSYESCYVKQKDAAGNIQTYPVADNYFLGGQNGTLHIDTYGYVDDVEVRFPTEAGHGTTLTLNETTYSTTLGDILLAAWYDQKRGLATGKLDIKLTFNDNGGTYAASGTEEDIRYTVAESGTDTRKTKELPTDVVSGNGHCQRYYPYQWRFPLYINSVLAKAPEWTYKNQIYKMITYETIQTARKHGTNDVPAAKAVAVSDAYVKCGTVGQADTNLTDTFHTVLYK